MEYSIEFDNAIDNLAVAGCAEQTTYRETNYVFGTDAVKEYTVTINGKTNTVKYTTDEDGLNFNGNIIVTDESGNEESYTSDEFVQTQLFSDIVSQGSEIKATYQKNSNNIDNLEVLIKSNSDSKKTREGESNNWGDKNMVTEYNTKIDGKDATIKMTSNNNGEVIKIEITDENGNTTTYKGDNLNAGIEYLENNFETQDTNISDPNTDWSEGSGELHDFPDSNENLLDFVDKISEYTFEPIDFGLPSYLPKEIVSYKTDLNNIETNIELLIKYLKEYQNIGDVIREIYNQDNIASGGSGTGGSGYSGSGTIATAINSMSGDDSNISNSTSGSNTSSLNYLGALAGIPFLVSSSMELSEGNGPFGALKFNEQIQLYDENGNPLYDENGNPIYADMNKNYEIIGYKMDENGKIYAYQLDNGKWVFLSENEQFYLKGQVGYYIFDGNQTLNVYDKDGNIIGTLAKGNYAVFDVKYNDKNEVSAIKIIVDGVEQWVYINENGNSVGKFDFIGNVYDSITEGTKFLLFRNSTVTGILGLLLITAGTIVTAKKLKKNKKDNDNFEEDNEEKIKEGKYDIYDIYRNDDGKPQAALIDKKKNLWINI